MRLRSRRLKPVKHNCLFCKEKKNPSYQEVDALARYTTERGKIVARTRTGTCAKHQRKLTVSIKHARHLALLPFVVKPY